MKSHLLTIALAISVAATVSITKPAWAQGARVTEASAKQKRGATKAYLKAVKAFEAGKYEQALTLLKESFERVASPNSELMIARTLIKLDRPVEALTALESSIKEAEHLAVNDEKYGKTVEAAQKELNDLRSELAFVRLMPPGKATLDGEELAATNWGQAIARKPGQAALVVQYPNRSPISKSLTLSKGQVLEVQTELPEPVEPAAPPTPSEPKPPPPRDDGLDRKSVAYVSGAIGLAGLATFGAFTAMNVTQFGTLRDECTQGVCDESTLDDAETSSAYRTLSYVGLGIGVTGIGIATVVLVSGESSSEKEGQPTASLTLSPRSVTMQALF